MFASPEERVGEAYFIMYIVFLVITVTNRIGSVFVSRLYFRLFNMLDFAITIRSDPEIFHTILHTTKLLSNS